LPELPDLVHVESKLRPALVGRSIVGARTGDPTVLRILVREPFPQVLAGRRIEAVVRRGHFMCFELDGDLLIAINAMLAGRYFLAPAGGKSPRALGLALELDGGTELRYVDDKRMGKVYVAPRAQIGDIPQLGTLGVEALSPELTRERFRALVRKRRDQVRRFLMDKAAIASIGNAYADEILFAARLHPKTFCHQLAPDDVDRLHDAVGQVLRDAIAEIARREPPIEDKLRDFLKVRGRAGKPCLVCGTTIREVRVGDSDACFCPQCQPAARKLFVDWSKLPAK
jgi:formamidopyrimidine-DNA glycosylase